MAGNTKFCQFIHLYGSFRSLFINRPLVVNCQTATITRASRDKLKTLPEKPKRPMAGFFLFAETRRQELHKQHPDAKVTVIAKMLGNEWKDVDPSIKEKYEKRYKEAMTEYVAQYMGYLSKLTEEQKGALEEISKQKKADKKKREEKKQMKEANKPKRPRGAFVYFVLENYDNKKSTYTDFLKTAKLMWEALAKEEKQKYHDMYMDDKKRYELELEQWETKMIKEGHLELVRSKTRETIKPPRYIHQKLSDSSETKTTESKAKRVKPIKPSESSE